MADKLTDEEQLAEDMKNLQEEIDSGEGELFEESAPEPEVEPEPTPAEPQGEPEPEPTPPEEQPVDSAVEPEPAPAVDGEPESAEGDPAPANDFEPITMKVGEYDVQITSQEELIAFAKRGIANSAPKTETHEQEKKILEQAGLTSDDLILLADAKAGNPQAIAKLAQMGKVDTLALREEDANGYTAKFNPRDYTEVEKVVRDIQSRPYEAQKFAQVSNSLPKEFIDAVGGNSLYLKAFNDHIQTGKAQAILPEAMKRQMIHGGTLFEHYDKVGGEMYSSQAPASTTTTVQSQAPVTPAQPARTVTKESTTARGRMGSSGYQPQRDDNSVASIMAMTDEEFEASITSGKTY